MATRRGILKGVMGAGLLGVAGCSSTGGTGGGVEEAQEGDAPILPEPKAVTVSLSAASDSNVGPSGRAAPTTVRLYTLRSVGTFQQLDFFELTGGNALGGAVVDSRTISLRPGESRNVTLNAGTDGAYLGVAAAYRDIDSARWRGQASLVGRENFAVGIGRAAVSVRAA